MPGCTGQGPSHEGSLSWGKVLRTEEGLEVVDGYRGGPSASPRKTATKVVDRVDIGGPSGQPCRLGKDPPDPIGAVDGIHHGLEDLAEGRVGDRERS